MRFYTQQHPFYCGIDLHARTMYVCILSQDGEVVLHRNMKAAPEPFLKAIAPYRDDMVGRRQMYLHVVLAGRSVCAGRAAFCPWPCPLYESDPWGQGQKRQDRLPENCRLAAWRHAAAGVCLSGRDARDP